MVDVYSVVEPERLSPFLGIKEAKEVCTSAWAGRSPLAALPAMKAVGLAELEAGMCAFCAAFCTCLLCWLGYMAGV